MRWKRFFERKRRDGDFADELTAYLAQETADSIARCMNAQTAREAALRKLGNRTALREEIHRMNSLGFLESIWQDLRHGIRTLRANPGFTLVAVLSLALGIGANAALFQLIDAVMLRSLPVKAPEQLVQIKLPPHSDIVGDIWDAPNNFTNAQWEYLRSHHTPFQGVFAWGSTTLNESQSGPIRFARVLFISGGFFHTLGVPALIGRTISPSDDHRGCGSSAAVISYEYWQRKFGGSLTVLGKTVTLERHRFPIIGVTPPAFVGVDVGREFDVAIPVCSEESVISTDSLNDPQFWWLGAFGRLKPGVSIKQANAYLTSMSPALYRATVSPRYRPETARAYLKLRLHAIPGGTGFSYLRASTGTALLLLFGLAALVLLIACVNIANLLLARNTVRQHEIAIRLAIGASRWRVAQQLLSESLVIAAVGAAAGAVLAKLLSSYLLASLGKGLYSLPLDFDTHFFVFLTGVTLVTCLLFGLAPALRASRRSPNESMKQGARTATGGRERFHPQRVLTVAQISFSLVLIVGALLFVRSFQKLMVLDPGFRTNGILVARLMFRPDVVPQKRRMAAYDAILKNLRAIPGVDSAAAVNNPPLMGGFGGDRIHIDGDNVESHYTNDNRVGEDYFATMGIPLLAGRGFNIHDSNSSAPVAIVDDTFAAQFLGGSDPIGRTFYSLPAPGQPIKRYQIVGLVGRSKYPGLVKGFDPIVYLSIRQQTDHWAGMNFEVHSNLPLAATMKTVQRAIMSVNSQFNIDLRSFPTEIHRSMRNESLIAQLSSFFGLLALILATVGLYGVMSFIVTHRRNEIGIRLAIGASRRAILGMILKQATVVLIAGLAAGVVFSLLLSRWAQSLLFDVKANDPYLIAAAALLLAVITIAATLIPARKAANLDPMQTLRNE